MSLAKTLLNSLDDYEATEVDAIEEEPHIIVGSNREITVPAKLKLIAVKGDKDIETVTIDCVRYWDNHDLSTFAIYINYILPNGDEGTYIPKNITKLDDIFTFDWKIGNETTYAQGKLTFWIVAKLTDDSGDLIKQWSSLQNSDCSIAQGGDKIYVPEKQTDQDVISQAISISRESAETAEQQANLAIEAANKAALDASQAAEEEVSRIIGELGVVQELGDSPNSVVSQLKVTNEFNQTNAKINRNSKRITNLEQGLPEELFVMDDSVAYQKDVPSNALPYAEILQVGGRTRKCTNLLNLADTSTTSNGVTATVSNQKISLSGVAKGSTWNIIGSVTLTVGSYMFSSLEGIKNNLSIYLYNTNQNTSINKQSIVVTETSKFDVVIQVMDTENDASIFGNIHLMLNEGSTALPYEPYWEGIREAKVTDIESRGADELIDTFHIPEAVQAIHGYGWGVDADCYNYIDWEKKQFVKRVGKVVLDGSTDEGWAKYGDKQYGFSHSVLKTSSTTKCLTDRFTYGFSAQSGTFFCGLTGMAFITDFATLDEWNAYLSTNPVMLYYQLATPEVTDISDLLSSDNFIEVEGGGVIAFENEYGVAVPSEVEYQVEV